MPAPEPQQLRRSERIRELNSKPPQNLQSTTTSNSTTIDRKSASKLKSKPKSILKGSKLRGRSKSVMFDSNIVSPVRRSSINVTNQRLQPGRRGRSKLVAFDSNILSPVRRVTPVPRNLFGNSGNAANFNQRLQAVGHRGRSKSVDSRKVTPKNANVLRSNPTFSTGKRDASVQCVIGVQSTSGGNQTRSFDKRDASVQCVLEQQSTSAVDAKTFEIRIEALIQSNQNKIGHIKNLRAERDLLLHDKEALLAEIETVHRINKAMGETIDEYRNNDDEAVNGIEIGTLKERIRKLNAENFQLRSCLKTHSNNISEEHNYV